MTGDRFSAPKADALPGCATPRTAVSLGNAAVEGNPESDVRGSERQNVAGTGEGSPEIVPNPPAMTDSIHIRPEPAASAADASSQSGIPIAAPHLEFRPDEKGRFDEIVARFADGMVHVETMSNKSCYVGFYWDDGRYCQWWISSDKKLHYHHEHGQGEPPRFNAQGMETRQGGNEVPSRSDDSPVRQDAPKGGQ